MDKNIDQYVTRLQKLSFHCEYENIVDEQIQYQVISSCLSSKLQKRYLTEPDLTLEKIIQIIQAMESAPHHSKKIEDINTSTSNHHDSLNKLAYQQKNRSTPPPSRKNCQSPLKTITVYGRCGAKATLVLNVDAQKAKLVPNVTSKVILLQYAEQKSQHVHKIKEKNTPPLEPSSDDETEIYVLNLSNQNGLPTQPVTVTKLKLDVLIDSGSTLNIINEKIFNSIVPTPKLKPSKATIYPYEATVALPLQGKFIAIIQSQFNRYLPPSTLLKEMEYQS